MSEQSNQPNKKKEFEVNRKIMQRLEHEEDTPSPICQNYDDQTIKDWISGTKNRDP